MWGVRAEPPSEGLVHASTDPKSASSPYNFDPDNILQQRETLYSFYVNTMKFTSETGVMALAQPGSWDLAHELGHVFQSFTFLGRGGVGVTDPSAGTF